MVTLSEPRVGAEDIDEDAAAVKAGCRRRRWCRPRRPGRRGRPKVTVPSAMAAEVRPARVRMYAKNSACFMGSSPEKGYAAAPRHQRKRVRR